MYIVKIQSLTPLFKQTILKIAGSPRFALWFRQAPERLLLFLGFFENARFRLDKIT